MKPGDLVMMKVHDYDSLSTNWPVWRGIGNTGRVCGWLTIKHVSIVLACRTYGHPSLGERTSVLVLTSGNEVGWNNDDIFERVPT